MSNFSTRPSPVAPQVVNQHVASVSSTTSVSSNGAELERQLDAIIKPTTVEDLARKTGPIKMVKERDLRELIRQSLLQLLQSSTAMAGLDHEKLLDQVQDELKRTMKLKAAEHAERVALAEEVEQLKQTIAHLQTELEQRGGADQDEVEQLKQTIADFEAERTESTATATYQRQQLTETRQKFATQRAELEALRAQLAAIPAVAPVAAGPATWVREIDHAWFADSHQALLTTETALRVPLMEHLTACQQLLAEHPAPHPGMHPAGDVVARIRHLAGEWLHQRARCVTLERELATLTQRQAEFAAERTTLRAELEALRAARSAPVAATPHVDQAGIAAELAALRHAVETSDRARHQLETELVAAKVMQADFTAITGERDWLREAVMSFTRLLAAAPAPVSAPAAATPAPSPAAPLVEPLSVEQPTVAPPVAVVAPASAPDVIVRRAGPAVLGLDGRARISYLANSVPRLLVHGQTWSHLGLEASKAAADAQPLLLINDQGIDVLYRDRFGALVRIGQGQRETVLPAGAADGDPAVLTEKTRWLLAIRQGNEAVIYERSAEARRELGRIPTAGDPVFIPGTKHAAARIAAPTAANTVAIHHLTPGVACEQQLTVTGAAPESLAVAGAGNDAVVVVRDAQGIVAAVHARRSGGWDAPCILDASGAPAIGRVAAAAHDGEIVVAYRASDGLLQLMLHRGAWRHLAFGQNFDAPAAAGHPALLLHDRLIRCFYPGTDGHMHEVRNSSAGWNAYDLSILSRDA